MVGLAPQGEVAVVLLQLFQQGAAQGGGVVDALFQLGLVHVPHVAQAPQAGLHFLVGQEIALGALGLVAEESALDHVHQHGLVLIVELLLAAKERFQPFHDAVAEAGAPDIKVGQLFLVLGRGQEAVIAVPVVAPLGGQHPGDEVAAGKDVIDVAGGPGGFQGTVGVVVVVVVQLIVRVAGGGQGHRRGKRVDEDVFAVDLGQVFVDPPRQQVGDGRAPAVAAHPELDGARPARLGGRPGQIISEGGQHLVHRDDKARVARPHTGVQVADPLAAVAAAPQDDGHNGRTRGRQSPASQRRRQGWPPGPPPRWPSTGRRWLPC